MSKSDGPVDKDSFLNRWSRKKRAGEDAPVEEKTASPEDPQDLSDEEILEKFDLPDPDNLEEGDDFSAFMNSAIPDHLRKRALRKLWLSNPALANLDGLVEYGEDYTDAAMVPEVLNTAYKVGRGFLKDILEEDAQDLSEPEDQGSEIAEEEAIAADEAPELEPEIELVEAEVSHHIPRPRMRFSTS